MRQLEGKTLASMIKLQARPAAEALRKRGIVPTLAVVVATEDPNTAWYVRSIEKAGKSCNIDVRIITLDAKADTDTIAAELKLLAADSSVHGLILQTPLPEGTDHNALTDLIPVQKDVDGVSAESFGRLANGRQCFAPATAEAVLQLLDYYSIELEGSHAVVVGRSRIVGKPASLLLLNRNATVTVCHSKTQNIQEMCANADILVAAVGNPGLITPLHVKENAVVIDVGTNTDDEGNLIGDVEPTVSQKADLSPVPGGVGPVTAALILGHTITAATLQAKDMS